MQAQPIGDDADQFLSTCTRCRAARPDDDGGTWKLLPGRSDEDNMRLLCPGCLTGDDSEEIRARKAGEF